MERPKHHIRPRLRATVQFALCRFRSPLLTASRLLSFPAGTKMFQFPAFPLAYASEPKLRKSHSGIPGSTAACASPGLIAACHALLRLPSRAIHLTASCLSPMPGFIIIGPSYPYLRMGSASRRRLDHKIPNLYRIIFNLGSL